MTRTDGLRGRERINPFQYPGGKYKLLPKLLPLLTEGDPSTFTDLFIGGGSVTLAVAEALPNAHLIANDLDPFISAFWRVVADGTDIPALQEKIMATEPSTDLYRELRPGQLTIVDRAFAALYVNRTSFSGIDDDWSDPSRWQHPERICRQIDRCHVLLAARTTVYQLPFQHVPWPDAARVYLDPPYVEEGTVYRLGLGPVHRFIDWVDFHESVMNHILDREGWVLSYDDHSYIRGLYSWATIREVPVCYTLARRERNEYTTELIITPPHPRPSNLPPVHPPQRALA